MDVTVLKGRDEQALSLIACRFHMIYFYIPPPLSRPREALNSFRDPASCPGSAARRFMEKELNRLKRHVFSELMGIVGRVFILVRHSQGVVIGNRGFSDDEKANGLILVFNPRMTFTWDEEGLSATLVFGSAPQKCFIPASDIIAIYSPELSAQFMASPEAMGEEEEKAPELPGAKARAEEEPGKVIEVDFTKKVKK